MKIEIPERFKEFALEVARLAAKHELQEFQLTIHPPLFDEWHSEIKASWKQGRHGVEAEKLTMVSGLTLIENFNIKPRE